jgi:two-component system sensor kinase FixL
MRDLFVADGRSLMVDATLIALGLALAGLIAFLAIMLARRRGHVKSAAIVEANRRFEVTFAQAAVGLAHMDAAGRWLRMNERYCQIAGYDCAELMALPVDDITHPDDLPRDRAERQALIAGEIDSTSTEKRYIRKDGSIVWVNVTRSAIRDAAGRPEFFVAVCEEITARKEAEARLTTGEAQYRAIFDSTVEAMAVIDAKGLIQSVNPSVERIFGYAPADLIGKNIRMLMPDSIASQHDDYLQRYRDTGRRAIIGIGREVLGRRSDGSLFPLDLSVAEWEREGETFFTGIMRDISARKSTETALRASEERLRLLQNEFAHLARVNDLGEMAAAIAHEINQPLTAIVNYLNTGLFCAVEGYSEDGFAETEQIMRDAAAQALRAGDIVRRLREFVGKGEGARTVEPADPLVDTSMALALIDARLRGILVERRSGAIDTEVEVDVIQIQQVLVNLLRNAVDALDSVGKDDVRRLSVITTADADFVEIAVADNGPGIAPQLAGHLFEPFITTKAKGMGMGLSVCRRLIEAHGGTIHAESDPATGATFIVRLPRFHPPKQG